MMEQNKQQFYKTVFDLFKKFNPLPKTELRYENPFQLLVAVVLSAQCTDARVNQITQKLFTRYPTAEQMATVSIHELYELIKSCSYPNSKAKYLSNIAKIISERYQGKVPQTLEELIQLPGVGRKTANVILSILYQQPTLAVDTHVFRVSQRIGLVEPTKSFLKVEKQLITYLSPEDIPKAHHWLIIHGRYICKARKPLCTECFLTSVCKFFNKS